VFGRVTDGEIIAALEDRGVPADLAADAVAASGGRPGLALMLATRPDVAAFRAAWLEVPNRLSEQPGEAFRLADELVAAADPLLEGLARRQEAEAHTGEAGVSKQIADRHDRERRRALTALHVTGLEILASWYRDAAAAPFGAPVRNRDVPGTALAAVTPAVAVAHADRVLAAIESLQSHQRAGLAFAALFSDLATPH
jgi:hypothetical protein